MTPSYMDVQSFIAMGVRLFQSIKSSVPDSISVIPSYNYKTDFAALQERLSTSHNSTYFFLGVCQILCLLNKSSAISSVHVYREDKLNLL